MAELASLQIKVVRDGIEQAQKALNDLSVAANNAEKSAGGVGKGYTNANSQTKSFASEIKGLAGVLAGGVIAAGLFNIGKSALTAAAEMEQQKVAFSTMLGSADKATKLLKEMQDFAASTPFSFNEITDAGKRLIAFGFDSETVIDNLRMLGDVSAGLSQPVGDMVYLFGQIKTQGRAMTQDLMQFANRGVPIYDELAKVLGVNVSQVKDFASQGRIGFKEIEQVFKNLTSEGGKFAGLMEAQSKTLTGQWSNFNDSLDQTLVLIGKELSPAASDLIVILSKGLDEITGTLKNDVPDSITMTGSIIKDIKNLLDGTAGTVEKIGTYLGEEKVEEIVNEVRKWEATSTGVSAKVGDLMKKYGDVNAAAGIYSEYVKGHVKLTDEQVRNLEDIIKKQQIILEGANPLTKAYTKMGEAFNKAWNKAKPGGSLPPPGNNSSSVGSGTPQWVKDQEYLQSALNGTGSELDQLNAKYSAQITKINDIQSAQGTSYETGILAAKTQSEVMKKWKEDADALISKYDTFGTSIARAFGLAGKEAEKLGGVIDGMVKQFASMSLNAAADGFEKIGEAWGKGEMSGKAFKEIMADMTMQIIEQLPLLFISAGLQVLTLGGPGMWPVGLGLIAIGLAGAVGVGYIKGQIADREAEQAASTAESAHGNVFGFARGGSFTNEIVNSPTRFAFASGGGINRGLMGEAGTEAVVPLTRMSNGNLGVASSGGGGEVNVNIVNNSGEAVDVRKNTGQSGTDITVTIGNIVNKGFIEGTFDKTIKARYGLSQRGI